MVQQAEGPDLPIEPAEVVRNLTGLLAGTLVLGAGLMEGLQGHHPTFHLIQNPVDDPHPPSADDVEDAVARIEFGCKFA